MFNLKNTLLLVVALLFCSALIIQGCDGNQQATEETTREFEFKNKLSDYGFFASNLKDMVPAQNVVPYNIITPLFTDYAIKDRFILLPATSKIQFTGQGILNFPDSTFLIKSFSYINNEDKKILVETRILFKNPKNHQWEVMNYLWNAEQTDATKFITGSRIPVTLKDADGKLISTKYQVPNVNDCKRCHINNNELLPIGPKARNLNYTLPGDSINQLSRWASMGILHHLPAINTIEKLPDWLDKKNYSVNERARAYLDINCSFCHTKGGDAYNTGLFLEYEQQDPNHIGIMKLPVSAGGGAGGLNYDIIPNNPEHSILLYRMNSTEPGTAMPELTRTVIHKEGVKLIREWITDMDKRK